MPSLLQVNDDKLSAATRKPRTECRLDKDYFPAEDGPLLRASNIHYELADRTMAMNCGGIGLMQHLVRARQLAEEIDRGLHVLKLHLPKLQLYTRPGKVRRLQLAAS